MLFFQKKQKSFFEGSEKKFEIIVKPESFCFRKQSFYKTLVKKANARIVNQFSNASCDAYLLSESSLFVWDDRLILITCGKTTLIEAVLYLLKRMNPSEVEAVFFQRKNEFFPLDQKTNFRKDALILKKKLKGKALQFGNLDEHHFFLFYLDQKYFPSLRKNSQTGAEASPSEEVASDRTIEILMYGSQKPLMFSQKNLDLKKFLRLEECFPGFSLQDHYFHPKGYSLNALRGLEYYTIHITPQEQGFYISFESNMIGKPQDLIQKVLHLFQPLSFDVISFFPAGESSDYKFESFFRSGYYEQRDVCGFDVSFSSFQTAKGHPIRPHSW